MQQDLTSIIQRLQANDPKYKKLDLREYALQLENLKELSKALENNNEVGDVKWGIVEGDGKEVKKLKQAIEDQIIKINQNYQYYPSDYIHGYSHSTY